MSRSLTLVLAAAATAGLWACTTAPAPGPTPQAAEMRFDLAAGNCDAPVSEGRATLSADRRQLSFHESVCTAVPAIAEARAGQQITLACQGEGESWRRQVVVDLSAEGLVLADADGTSRYSFCPRI